VCFKYCTAMAFIYKLKRVAPLLLLLLSGEEEGGGERLIGLGGNLLLLLLLLLEGELYRCGWL
jgi:hypothetical protein